MVMGILLSGTVIIIMLFQLAFGPATDISAVYSKPKQVYDFEVIRNVGNKTSYREVKFIEDGKLKIIGIDRVEMNYKPDVNITTYTIMTKKTGNFNIIGRSEMGVDHKLYFTLPIQELFKRE
jgi:hypothetical protein